MRPPRGDLLKLGINPFNYNIVFSYQNHSKGIEYLDLVIKQLHSQIMAMESLGYSPTLQSLIDWVKDGNQLPESQSEIKVTVA